MIWKLSMPRGQQGASSFDALLLLLFIGAMAVFAWGSLPASAADVEEVTVLAESSQAAVAVLRKGLSEHPAPSNGELGEIRRAVNEAVVLSRSHAVTGRPNLEVAYEAASSPGLADNLAAGSLQQKLVVGLILAMLLGFGAIAFLRTLRS